MLAVTKTRPLRISAAVLPDGTQLQPRSAIIQADWPAAVIVLPLQCCSRALLLSPGCCFSMRQSRKARGRSAGDRGLLVRFGVPVTDPFRPNFCIFGDGWHCDMR